MKYETAPVERAVEEDMYAGYNFMYNPVDRLGSRHLSIIDNLPSDKLEMDMTELRQLGRLIRDPHAFAAAGYSEAPGPINSLFSEDSITMYMNEASRYPLLTLGGQRMLARAIMT